MSFYQKINTALRFVTERNIWFSRREEAVYCNNFRRGRFIRFLSIVDEIIAAKGSCRIVDLGGVLAYWKAMENLWNARLIHITIINLKGKPVVDEPITVIIGDARDMRQFDDNAFDIVHSNSVIEHVGLWNDQLRMAREIRRLAPRYFVQTPNSRFPIEPHYRMPFIHWLPESWRIAIIMRCACGFYPRARSINDARKIIYDACPLSKKQMTRLFPDANIELERFAFLTKSLIAIR